MAKISDIPAWWFTMTGRTAVELMPFLRAVEAAGISRNDRTLVGRMWRERRLTEALRKINDEPQNPC